MADLIETGPAEWPDHPIPRLDTLDTLLTHDRGAYVGIVIASPLTNDSVSRARLLRKLMGCLEYFQLPGYLQRFGAPRGGPGC